MAKVFQAYILSKYVTKVFPLLARCAPQLPPPSPPSAAAVDLELAAEPAALTVKDSQNYLAWEKLIVAFCLGSSLEIATLFAQIGPARLPVTFTFLSLAILLAFTCLCVGKYFSKSKFLTMARMLEQLGGFFVVTAFFIAIAIPFPLWLQCCTGAVYSISFLSILIYNLF
ncbi:hypothetical protein QQP08_011684 [Theobroma cacao]|nr:hypothetical protein QQP08_011684 [Theobroma cacao]